MSPAVQDFAPVRDTGWRYSLAPMKEAGVVFVHVPKTGGLSIARALYGTEGGGHRTAADYRRQLGDDAYEAMVSLAVVREPTERLASAFAFLQRGGLNALDRAFRDAYLFQFSTLESFVLGGLAEVVEKQVHFRPQHRYVCHEGGTLDVDHVLRHETLRADYERLRPVLGGDPLPHLNATGASARLARSLSADAREVVARVYSRDFSLFGYPSSSRDPVAYRTFGYGSVSHLRTI